MPDQNSRPAEPWVIAFHTHCFPQRIAGKAMPILMDECGARAAFTNGTREELLAAMDRAGIGASVALNIATNPRQQRAVNDFAIALNAHPGLYAFGSVHPDAPDAVEELRRLKEAGLRGIKLHPEYQKFFVNEPRVYPIYREAARLGLITVFHAGADIGMPVPVRCTPAALAEALPQWQGAPVVAAHFGGYILWREVLEHLCGREIYFDSSYCAGRLPLPWAKEILEAHGANRILFGSDQPWSDPADELHYLRQLGASPEETALMLGGNAERLLGACRFPCDD
ncbi:MAG: amidohydrolase family protein [Oscillospiraceae bacterium]|nr:amidohydrolase family protein [Oscillospiraceae bacterium]